MILTISGVVVATFCDNKPLNMLVTEAFGEDFCDFWLAIATVGINNYNSWLIIASFSANNCHSYS